MSNSEYDYRKTQAIMEANGWVRSGEASYTTPEEMARNTPERQSGSKRSWEFYFSLLDEEKKRGTNDSWKQASP